MEERLLQQNVTGQYSYWERDDKSGPNAGADGSDDSACEKGDEKEPPMQVWVWIDSYQRQCKR